MLGVQLLIMAVFGTITALIAHSKGRSALGWFFIGFLFGLIGLIISLVVSDLKKEQEREERLRRENRRLRERMRKERMVADRRHREVQQRLGAHDGALGIDTAPPERPRHLEVDDLEDDAEAMGRARVRYRS